MKKLITLIASILISYCSFSQNWFRTYTDSAALVNDANILVQQFQKDVKAINPSVDIQTKAILNTQPYLVSYMGGKVNLPMWSQLSTNSKKFFVTIGGNEKQGKRLFGLMFNGFYLQHEMGHAWQSLSKIVIDTNRYQSEYQANIIGMLWWKKQGYNGALKKCYAAVKKAFARLKNPVPSGQTMGEYFTVDYWEKVKNPFIYGYMQWWQFIKIYEDKSLPDFDTYIKNFSNRQTQ